MAPQPRPTGGVDPRPVDAALEFAVDWQLEPAAPPTDDPNLVIDLRDPERLPLLEV